MQVTPELAANTTEELWQARANGKVMVGRCGWCEFAHTVVANSCIGCPIVKLTGQVCAHFTDFWKSNSKVEQQMAATKLLRLLIKNRERLIAAAQEIPDEAK